MREANAKSTTGGSLPLSMSNGPAIAALLFASRPLLPLTSGGQHGASGLYRFYLPLIADLLGRLLVRPIRSNAHPDTSIGITFGIDAGIMRHIPPDGLTYARADCGGA